VRSLPGRAPGVEPEPDRGHPDHGAPGRDRPRSGRGEPSFTLRPPAPAGHVQAFV